MPAAVSQTDMKMEMSWASLEIQVDKVQGIQRKAGVVEQRVEDNISEAEQHVNKQSTIFQPVLVPGTDS